MLTKEGRLRRGAAAIGLPAVLPMAENGIRFLLSAVLAGTELPGGSAMCGVAMVGAFGAGSGGVAALLGACFGYLSFRGLGEALRYISASVLVFAVAFALGDAPLVKRRWFMPLTAAVLNGAVGFICLSEGGWSGALAVQFATEVLLTGMLAYLYRLAFSVWQDARETPTLTAPQAVGLLTLACCVLAALARVSFSGGLSLGRVLAAALAVLAGWRRGMGAGAAVGLAAGLAMDLSAGEVPYYAALYAFSGLAAGVFQKQGRLFTAVGFATAGGAAVLWTWGDGTRLWALYELLMGAGVFLLLPDRLLGRLEALARPADGEDGAARARTYISGRLCAEAGAFRALASELDGLFRAPAGEPAADTRRLLSRAAGRACTSCSLHALCWEKDAAATCAALEEVLPTLLDRGRGTPGDYPEAFARRCVDLPGFSSAVNEELAACLTRRQCRAKVRRSRGAVCRQYDELACLLEDASEGLRQELAVDVKRQRRLRQRLGALGTEGGCAAYYDENGRLRLEVTGPGARVLNSPEELAVLSQLMEVPLRVEEDSGGGRLKLAQSEPLMAVAGIAARQKEGQTVSGDAGAWFKDGAGRLHIFLCDGMGSGPEAHEDSTGTVGLLEKFLRAGVDPTQALITLNGALALRGEEDGGFTTIDLLRLDLFTGKGAVYKFGAAPTYLRRAGRVRRLAGMSLPAGSEGENVRPDVLPLEVGDGDWIVMASDGVTGGEEDWIAETLERWEGDSPRLLAQQLLEGCLHRETGQDDKTVVAVRLAWRN